MNPRAPFLIFLLGCDVGADELTGLSETLITVASDEDVRVLEAKDDELVALLQELRDTITAQEVRIVDLEESCDLGLNGENYATREWVESLGSTNALLSNYVTVDEAESAIIFSGINVHIRSGSGTSTDDEELLGLGNLIIGYNEDSGDDDRSGSHNLVVGGYHSYSSYGGLVTGLGNAITAPHAVSIGGRDNLAAGSGSAVLGGFDNNAEVSGAVVIGGQQNTGKGYYATIVGGYLNETSGSHSVITGGSLNLSSGSYSVTSGGSANDATEYGSSVSGGTANTASGFYSSVSGGATSS